MACAAVSARRDLHRRSAVSSPHGQYQVRYLGSGNDSGHRRTAGQRNRDRPRDGHARARRSCSMTYHMHRPAVVFVSLFAATALACRIAEAQVSGTSRTDRIVSTIVGAGLGAAAGAIPATIGSSPPVEIAHVRVVTPRTSARQSSVSDRHTRSAERSLAAASAAPLPPAFWEVSSAGRGQ